MTYRRKGPPMKTYRLSLCSLGVLASMTMACASTPMTNTTGGGGSTGGGNVTLDAENLLSDFDDPAAATIVHAGTPQRNGYWYSYNDASTGCTQTPGVGAAYTGATPPSASPKSG